MVTLRMFTSATTRRRSSPLPRGTATVAGRASRRGRLRRRGGKCGRWCRGGLALDRDEAVGGGGDHAADLGEAEVGGLAGAFAVLFGRVASIPDLGEHVGQNAGARVLDLPHERWAGAGAHGEVVADEVFRAEGEGAAAEQGVAGGDAEIEEAWVDLGGAGGDGPKVGADAGVAADVGGKGFAGDRAEVAAERCDLDLAGFAADAPGRSGGSGGRGRRRARRFFRISRGAGDRRGAVMCARSSGTPRRIGGRTLVTSWAMPEASLATLARGGARGRSALAPRARLTVETRRWSRSLRM